MSDIPERTTQTMTGLLTRWRAVGYLLLLLFAVALAYADRTARHL